MRTASIEEIDEDREVPEDGAYLERMLGARQTRLGEREEAKMLGEAPN